MDWALQREDAVARGISAISTCMATTSPEAYAIEKDGKMYYAFFARSE